MKKKIEELLKSYKECICHYTELAEKGDDYAKGLNHGYADSLSSVIRDLETVLKLEGE